jgi:signal transduction histidine kinase
MASLFLGGEGSPHHALPPRSLSTAAPAAEPVDRVSDSGSPAGMARLVQVVQELSIARDLPTILAITRRAARELTGADGATIALRDGDQIWFADEDAIAPLWKGQRFALDRSLTGRAIAGRETLVIDDVAADLGIVAEPLRDSFIRSLAIVPIRRLDPNGPIGAIGIYRAAPGPFGSELHLVEALADSTGITIANVELWAGLESRVTERTAQLEATNHELEAFSYAVSHDLRAPLRAINGFSKILLEDHAAALGDGREYLLRIRGATTRMAGLIDDLLRFAQMATGELEQRSFDLAGIAHDIVDELRGSEPDRRVDVIIPAALAARGDARLVRVVLENLLRNAWKFTSRRPAARIELGVQAGAYFVRDNGAGFDPAHADQLFTPFQRLHSAADFDGTGIGLATAQRIVHRHGGRIWGDSIPDGGATFYFTLG